MVPSCTCVHVKAYSVSELREQLAAALDRAERGEAVVVARRGRRFRIVAEAKVRKAGRESAFFELTDPNLLERGWSWEWAAPAASMRLGSRRPPTRR